MTRILLCWEMGKNYGHLSTIVPLVRGLKARGADIYMALQNPLSLYELIDDPDIHVLPAPHVRPQHHGPGKPPPILNYGDDITPCGYGKASDLVGLIRSWYTIYDLVMPDLVVTDAAPTALLAAAHHHIPTVSLGTGYNTPPNHSPMPPILQVPQATPETLRAHEDRILGVINSALDTLRQPRLKILADLLHADYRALTTLPELDHYGPRTDEVYNGPMFMSDSGTAPTWPKAEGQKIFAYIRPGHPLFAATLAALKSLPYPSLVIAPQASDRVIADFSAPHLKIQRETVQYKDALAQADLVINHASHGTSAAAFLAGCPQLFLPSQMEQLMFAQRVVATKTATLVHINAQLPQLITAIKNMMENPSYKAAAKTFRDKYASFDAQKKADELAHMLFDMAIKPGYIPTPRPLHTAVPEPLS